MHVTKPEMINVTLLLLSLNANLNAHYNSAFEGGGVLAHLPPLSPPLFNHPSKKRE